jgi:hypothetical protein
MKFELSDKIFVQVVPLHPIRMAAIRSRRPFNQGTLKAPGWNVMDAGSTTALWFSEWMDVSHYDARSVFLRQRVSRDE